MIQKKIIIALHFNTLIGRTLKPAIEITLEYNIDVDEVSFM